MNINTKQAESFKLPSLYHDKITDWQKKNFKDLSLLTKYWSKHFPGQPEYSLNVKLQEPKSDKIECGVFKGQPRIVRASDMKGNMFYSALGIVKAQCSTELGSIQQHMCTIDATETDYSKFSILRIMAEELRHAYQMFWVLCHDESWSTTGGIRNLADNTIDELLAMHTGTHVLDAFNIPFSDILDNIVFAFLIDRVGKYQLTMQKSFSYKPMAMSMQPMLKEESFHLKSGYELLEEVVDNASKGNGSWTLGDVQKRINLWYPRGLEMFGSPEGGSTNIAFSFKDKLNGESVEAYKKEVDRLIQRFNAVIAKNRNPDLSDEQIKKYVEDRRDDDFLVLPSDNFFRMRGMESIVYKSFGVGGEAMSEDGFIDYLVGVLPVEYMKTDVFKKYLTEFNNANTSI